MKNVLDTHLTGKVAVVTGAGGVLCSEFSRILARAGAKVALLDLNDAAAEEVAASIREEGLTAKAYKCNVLDKAVCLAVAEQVKADFGPCDILINGAGGNNPRATTDHETYQPGDIDADTKSFFDLDADGVSFVFNLNFLGTLPPAQVFCRAAVQRLQYLRAGRVRVFIRVQFDKGFHAPRLFPGRIGRNGAQRARQKTAHAFLCLPAPKIIFPARRGNRPGIGHRFVFRQALLYAAAPEE